MPDTIDTLLRARARLGDKPFLIDTTTRISYADLAYTTAELAARFAAAGVTKGSRSGRSLRTACGGRRSRSRSPGSGPCWCR